MRQMKFGLVLGVAALLGGARAAAQTVELRTRDAVLQFSGVANSEVKLSSKTAGGMDAVADMPVRLFLCHVERENVGSTRQCADEGTGFSAADNVLEAKYAAVHRDSAKQVTASAMLTAKSGAAFEVIDVYRSSAVDAGAFTVARTVKVTKAIEGLGFNSQFAIGFATAAEFKSLHFFAPALWYDRNEWAGEQGIATDTAHHSFFYWRETRSSLPMVMMQDDATGSWLTLTHVGANGSGGPQVSSDADEKSRQWLVDASVHIGSLGVTKGPATSLGFVYPAEEGEIAYFGGAAKQWVRRSHPVDKGVEQHYTLVLMLGRRQAGKRADFAAAMEESWRRSFKLIKPTVAKDTSEEIWIANVQLLKTVFSQQGPDKAPGFPFKISNLETGGDAPYSYQMGFTGQQIPLGFILMRTGVLSNDADAKSKGKAILDFWATEELRSSKGGLPLTWYQPNAPPEKRWMNFSCTRPIFLRSASDGMEGMASALSFAMNRREARSENELQIWRKFAAGYADWLVSHQETDGSFMRAFNADGSSWTERPGCTYPGGVDGVSRMNTTFPIRFLVAMWFITGNTDYKKAAERAGEWGYTNIYLPGRFVGGVANRNTLDKEAGSEALEAALALYDLANQDGAKAAASKWLGAARRAADYLETWQYVWDFRPRDLTEGKLYRAYANGGVMANSFIGTGGSASDIFLALCSFNFYRLHLLTGEGADGHYGHFAELLENNTAITTQTPSQRFGWKYDGLTGEAINLSNLEFKSGEVPIGWLAWISNAQINPMQRLEDAFGSKSITQLLVAERKQPSERAQLKNTNRTLYWKR